jgi:hypothetical protein
MPVKTKCQCSCNCSAEFEPIDKELLLNLITHGRVDAKRAEYLTIRVGSKLQKLLYRKAFQAQITLRIRIYWNKIGRDKTTH